MDKKKEKVHLHAGDVVMVRHSIPNKPRMIVKRVRFAPIPKKTRDEYGIESEAKRLLGVVCFWFDTKSVYNEQEFNSKDLELC